MIRVLIADDHRLFREGVRQPVKRAEDEDIEIVGEARDGQEAVALGQGLQPDIILMDIEMPGLNGFQATQQLTAAGNPANILILSTRTDERDMQQADHSGAKGYLVKNISRELIGAIRSTFTNRPMPSSDGAGFWSITGSGAQHG